VDTTIKLPYGWTECEAYQGFIIATAAGSGGLRMYAGWEMEGDQMTRSWSTRAQVRKAIRDGQTYRGPKV
jgi:hypothetical protein